jgi:hypothetical protein
MSWRQQLITLNSAQITLVDTQLKAITDGTGRQVFPVGHSSTQQKFREEFERLPQVMEQVMRIYETALNLEIAGASANASNAVIVTYRPGAVTLSEPGVYGTWTELMDFVATVTSVVAVQFDASLAACEIPAGTHVFPYGSIFAGQFSFPFVDVTFLDGAEIEGVVSFIRGIRLINQSSSPVIALGVGQYLLTFERGAEPQCTGTAPFVQLDGAGLLILALYGGQLPDGGAGQATFEVLNGGTMFVNPVVSSNIGPNTLASDGTSITIIQIYGDTTYDATQPALTGTTVIDYLDVADNMKFNPATAGNQLVATRIQTALDELTNKHVNRRSQTQSAAGTLTLAVDSAKLVLVDASAIGAGVINIDLPDPAADSGPWKIKRVDANGAATVNIRGTAGALVDGVASQLLGVSPASANLETDGTDWYRI